MQKGKDRAVWFLREKVKVVFAEFAFSAVGALKWAFRGRSWGCHNISRGGSTILLRFYEEIDIEYATRQGEKE